jgi:hypothetical protein
MCYLRVVTPGIPSTHTSSTAFSLLESVPAGSKVASLGIYDPEQSDMSWSMTAGGVGSTSKFSVDPERGALYSAGELDFETLDEYTVTVTVTDAGG